MKVPAEINVRKGTIYVFEDSACLACFDRRGMLVLVQQFREAHARQTIELPGGNVRVGEGAQDAALREFEEEIGIPRPRSAELLFTLDLDLSTSRHRTHVFKSSVDFLYSDTKFERDVKVLSPHEAISTIKRGFITHAPTVAAIFSQGAN